MSIGTPNPHGSVFFALPFVVEDRFTVTGYLYSTLPWQAVGGMGLLGKFSDDPTGQLSAIIAFEWPIPASTTLSKKNMEWAHLSRFQLDVLLRTGVRLYLNAREGTDPPDFIADGRQGAYGIECTQYASAKRRGMQGLFGRVRRAVRREPPERFIKLQGHMIYMWFREAGRLGLPPRSSDSKLVAEILDSLADYQPDSSATIIPPGPLPELAPDLPISTTPSGCSFYAIPALGPVHTEFFARTGFEFGVAYTTVHRQADIADEIARLIANKDKPGVNDLLITVGGPDRNGLAFQSEEYLVGVWLDTPPSVIPTNCVSRIFVHIWSTGAVFQLAPEFGLVTRPM